jgi:glycosyltransferase involved in cell wall biosynthesis
VRVSQAVFGVFHHFELAHQLRRYDYLDTVYTTFPWARLRREGLPHEYVKTFPWIHAPLLLLARRGLYPSPYTESLDWWNALAFDTWLTRRIAGSKAKLDALIGISGAGLTAGAVVHSRGGKYICDRSSTHARFQGQILQEEFLRWNVPLETLDIRDTEREERQYEMADSIVVPSHFALRSFLSQGVPRQKLHVIPLGTRLDIFRPQAGPSSGEFNVIFAGQVSIRKGVPYLFQAFERLKHPRKRLRIVGAVQAEIRPLLARLPLDQVDFLGVVSGRELALHLDQSHVLVLPSIEDGWGMVLGEAMACGCPVIATTNSAAENLFTDGVEGFIVPIRDPEAIADRLQQFADDPALQQRMSAAALDRVQHLGGWNDYGDRWAQLLRQVCTPASSGTQKEKPD